MGERSGSLWIPPHCPQLTSPPCCSAFCQELTGVRTWGPSLTRILKGRAWCNPLSSLTVSFWQPRSPAVSLNSDFTPERQPGYSLKTPPRRGQWPEAHSPGSGNSLAFWTQSSIPVQAQSRDKGPALIRHLLRTPVQSPSSYSKSLFARNLKPRLGEKPVRRYKKTKHQRKKNK